MIRRGVRRIQRHMSWLFPLVLAGGWHWLWAKGIEPTARPVLPAPRRYVPKVRFVGQAQSARRSALDPPLLWRAYL